MRIFLAVPLEPGVQERLREYQEAWRKTISNVKWVEQENLHLTLKFLGEVREQNLEAIKKRVAAVALDTPSCTVRLKGWGAFPGARRARVLWVGLEDTRNQLRTLAQRLDAALVSLGFPPEERPFTPHLTLGRLRQPAAIVFPTVPLEGPEVKCQEIVLYRSELLPRGPVYRALSSFRLKKEECTNKGAGV